MQSRLAEVGEQVLKLSGSSPYPLPLVQGGFPRASDAAAAPAAFAICKFLSAHLCEKEGSVCSVRAGLAEGEAARRAETAVSTSQGCPEEEMHRKASIINNST
ncbi:unnamed protein product [Natator depressus]